MTEGKVEITSSPTSCNLKNIKSKLPNKIFSNPEKENMYDDHI